jgi:hypothetical protein
MRDGDKLVEGQGLRLDGRLVLDEVDKVVDKLGAVVLEAAAIVRAVETQKGGAGDAQLVAEVQRLGTVDPAEENSRKAGRRIREILGDADAVPGVRRVEFHEDRAWAADDFVDDPRCDLDVFAPNDKQKEGLHKSTHKAGLADARIPTRTTFADRSKRRSNIRSQGSDRRQ